MDRLSKTELLNNMVGVRKINIDEQSEVQFKLILMDTGSLLWREVESVDKLLPFEKLLYRSFDFRTAALIVQDYCIRLGEDYALQKMIDEFSEKLLSHDIALQNECEAKLFFDYACVKKMLSIFQAFELFSVLVTKPLWQLLCVLHENDSLNPDNLKILLSLSPDLYAKLTVEIINMPQKTAPVCLFKMIDKKTTIDRMTSPVVFSEVPPVYQLKSVFQPVSPARLGDVLDRSNEPPFFLTVRSATLFSRSPNSSPFGTSAKSPKTSCFSPVASPRHTDSEVSHPKKKG